MKDKIETAILVVSTLMLLGTITLFIYSFGASDRGIASNNVLLDSGSNVKISNNVLLDSGSISSDELHWGKMPITYRFVQEKTDPEVITCPVYQVERVRDAFQIIHDETHNVVSFKEVEIGGDILVRCNGSKADDQLFMRLGDGYYGSSNNLITYGELNFYTHRNCGTWPDIEIHEILHVFGFDHTTNKRSIMYPIASSCDLGKIDEDIVQSLITTYS